MRVALLHFGQSVDFVVSITFLRSPVFAIFAMIRVFLLMGLSLRTAAVSRVLSDRSWSMGWIGDRLQRRGFKLASGRKKIQAETSSTRSFKFTTTDSLA
jgi:hypothetical protein